MRSVTSSQSIARAANARSSSRSASQAADAVLHVFRDVPSSTQRTPPPSSSPDRTKANASCERMLAEVERDEPEPRVVIEEATSRAGSGSEAVPPPVSVNYVDDIARLRRSGFAEPV
jgi:hypothetical protein